MINLDKNLEWVARVLERYGISPSGILALKLMRGGIENDVIRVALSDGLVIIRRYLKSSAPEVEFECSILERIAGKCDGVATPLLRRTTEGELYLRHQGNLFTVYNYLSGSHPAMSSPSLIHDVCRFARRLQEVTSAFEWVGNFQRLSISQVGALALTFISENQDVLTTHEVELLNREVADLVNNQKILARFPKVIVHGDLHGGNLLVDNSGRLNAILDFDDACLDFSVLEFAGIARGHCFDDECLFSFEECKNVYFEAGDAVTKLCDLNEFFKVVKLICLRYMLYIYYGNIRFANARLSEQRLLNQWLDFKRWISIDCHG